MSCLSMVVLTVTRNGRPPFFMKCWYVIIIMLILTTRFAFWHMLDGYTQCYSMIVLYHSRKFLLHSGINSTRSQNSGKVGAGHTRLSAVVKSGKWIKPALVKQNLQQRHFDYKENKRLNGVSSSFSALKWQSTKKYLLLNSRNIVSSLSLWCRGVGSLH